MKKDFCVVLVSLVFPVLVISGRIGEEYQNDYPGDYNEADYENGIEYSFSEENNEKESDRTPTFISSGKTLFVSEGDAIKLPCLVDNLENLLIIWKKGNKIITLGDKPYEDDDSRVQVEKAANGNTLVIRLSEEKDAGDYVCQLSSAKSVELTHTVKIIVRPDVESVPKSGILTVSVGDPAELSCKVTRGSPEPNVTWKRKDHPMPSGKESLSGPTVTFPQTSRHHSGLYTCYADNGWRSAATATIRLDVQHAPEIEQEVMKVQNNDETEVRLICIVHASPLVTVEWYKDGQKMVVKDNVISKRGNRHTLLLIGISEDDRNSKFECRARNAIGEATAVVGVPFDATDIKSSKEAEIIAENSKIKKMIDDNSDAALSLEELDRAQEFQNKIKIPLDQKTEEIDQSNENVGSEGSEETDQKNKDVADNVENAQEASQISDDTGGLVATDLDSPVSDTKAEGQSSKAKTNSKAIKTPVNTESQEASNAEKLRDTNSSEKSMGNFFLYLILPVIYTLGL